MNKPIQRMLKIGKYITILFHPGQPEFQNISNTNDIEKTCHTCLTPGHFNHDCGNDWVCRKCHESGHKMVDCSTNVNEKNSEQEQYHAGTDNGLNDDETSTKQDYSNGRQTYTQPQTHADVDVTIANTNKSTKASKRH